MNLLLHKLKRFIFALWYLPILILGTCIAGTACFFISFISIKTARYMTDFWWSYLVFWPARIKVETQGRENLPPDDDKGFIIYANHRSLTDIPTVSLATNRVVTWIAKAPLAKIPFFGWAMARVHMLVDRDGSLSSAKKMVTEAEKRIAQGEILALFPEGTRNKTEKILLDFKKGAFMLAKNNGLRLIPLAIKNAGDIWPAQSFLPKSGTIKVVIGEPLLVNEGESLKQITQKAQEAIIDLLENKLV